MKRRTRFLYMLTAAAMSILLGAAPAWAAGSFTWSAHLKYSVTSRQWTQKSGGSVTIWSTVTCNGETGSHTLYGIDLWKTGTILPTEIGAATFTCNQSQQYTWPNLKSGTYYFTLTKYNDGIYWDPSGSVSYP